MRRDWHIGGWVFVGLMLVAMVMVAVSIAGHVLWFVGVI
jgi:hypothetical protein